MQEKNAPQLKRDLGLLETVNIVIGILIGSGIFVLPAQIFSGAQTPGMGLLAWIVAGAISIAAGLSISELAAAMPQAGGTYVYLREAYGDFWAFMQGWVSFLAYSSAITAALAIVFTTYLSVLYPLSPVLFKVIAISMVVFLTIINYFGVRFGGYIQNIFTFGKLFCIAALVIFGFTLGKAANFTPLLPTDGSFMAPLAAGVIAALWAYDGWLYVAMMAEEIKNPQRNLPLALIFGITIVSIIYAVFNAAVLNVMPMHEVISAGEKAGTVMAVKLFGTIGGSLIGIGILISVFGTLNGVVMSAPRYYYAMARDNLFFASKTVGSVHPKYKTPHVSLFIAAVWSSVLILTGSFGQLIGLVVCVAWLFYVLSLVAIFILRKKQPDLPRPYKVIGYPITPLVAILGGLWILLESFKALQASFMKDPTFGLVVMLVLVAGLPAYFYLESKKKKDNNVNEKA